MTAEPEQGSSASIAGGNFQIIDLRQDQIEIRDFLVLVIIKGIIVFIEDALVIEHVDELIRRDPFCKEKVLEDFPNARSVERYWPI